MYKRKRAGNTITRKINSTKDTAAKADKNHYISNSYLEGFIPIDTEYFTASFLLILYKVVKNDRQIIYWIFKLYRQYILALEIFCQRLLDTYIPLPFHLSFGSSLSIRSA